jgi:hypothetical protein
MANSASTPEEAVSGLETLLRAVLAFGAAITAPRMPLSALERLERRAEQAKQLLDAGIINQEQFDQLTVPIPEPTP